jgi:hypothetical protein
MKNLGRLLFAVFFSIQIFSTTGLFAIDSLSVNAKISLITCSPGTELYSTFGHSAIRISDPEHGLDSVYNYGTFDFNTPNFYLKFSQGKLDYMLSRQYWPYFQYEYIETNRWIKEQDLLLNVHDKQAVYELLETNYRPENRFYRYDFFYDNCATRIRDIFKQAMGNRLVFPLEEHTGMSFRNQVEVYTAGLPWSKFGISIALGWPYEKEMQAEEIMFLPDDLLFAFSVAQLDGENLCGTAVEILPSEPEERDLSMRVVYIFGCVFLILALLCLVPGIKNGLLAKMIGSAILLVSGLGGMLVLLLWFATDHQATKMNPDILWLMPVHLYAAFSHKLPSWYYMLCSLLIVIAGLMSIFGPLPLYYLPFEAAILTICLFRYFRKQGISG